MKTIPAQLGFLDHNRCSLVEDIRVQVEESYDKRAFILEKLSKLGIQIDIRSDKEALFVLQGVLEWSLVNEPFCPSEALLSAHHRIAKLRKEHPWMFAGELKQEVKAEAKPKTKVEVAEALYKEFVIQQKMSNADFVRLLQEKLAMSVFGARTYATNLKKKFVGGV